jgi:hypothetical protein
MTLSWIFAGFILHAQFRESYYSGKNTAEIMGYADCKRTDRLQLLRLSELFLKALLSADIPRYSDVLGDGVHAIFDRGHGNMLPEDSAVFFSAGLIAGPCLSFPEMPPYRFVAGIVARIQQHGCLLPNYVFFAVAG